MTKVQIKEEKYSFISIDEILICIIGIIVFSTDKFIYLRFYFVVGVILWYWAKIRFYETKAHRKKQEIYNVLPNECKPVSIDVINGRTKIKRIPLYYDLEQLEYKRKSLVDKFVVVNLILMVLIELFIKK